MGNSKKLNRAARLVLSGTSIEDASDTVGVAVPLLQAKMERVNEIAAQEKTTLQELRLVRFSDDDLARWHSLLNAGVSEVEAFAKSCPYPQLLTKEEADTRFDITSKLKPGQNYEGYVIVARPEDLVSNSGAWMSDEQFNTLWEFGCGYDILTVIVEGDVTLQEEANISDRVQCLIVTGNFTAPQLHVFETEVYILGDLAVQLLTDHDDLVTVLGRAEIAKVASYDD